MRARIVLHGIVQGVGYRFFVVDCAKHYNITGYVQNLPNGHVEVIAEGAKGILKEFIKELRIGPVSAHVTGIDVQWKEEEHGFTDFDIRF